MRSTIGRRAFLRVSGGSVAALVACAGEGKASAADAERRSLAGVVGLTTGGLNYQREHGILTALTLPEFVGGILGMQLIDLNTRWLTSFEEDYVQGVRGTAEKSGCYFTNLKVNHSIGDLYSGNPEERAKAMTEGRQMVRVAQTLGARWIRFSFPKSAAADGEEGVSAHRELAVYAKGRDVQLIVENGGWMKSDPGALPRLVKAIGENVAPGPDTGNWDDDVRYEALKNSFPGAATCDFKVFELDANLHHAKYDIKKCFDIGWEAGFRGPWAIEYWNEDTEAYVREIRFLRDQLLEWMAAAG